MISEDDYRELVGEKMIIEIETIFCDICGEDTEREYPNTCNICKKDCCHTCIETTFAPTTNNICDTSGTGVINICIQCRNNPDEKHNRLFFLIEELSELEEEERKWRDE